MGFSVSRVGDKYYYRCRVPADLVDKFPSTEIKKSLRTSDRKQATLLAASFDFQTKKLFTEIRTGMLDPHLEKFIIARHLHTQLELIAADLYAKKYSTAVTSTQKTAKALDQYQADRQLKEQLLGFTDPSTGVEKRSKYLQALQAILTKQLATKNPYPDVMAVAENIAVLAGVKPSKAALKSLALQILANEMRTTQAEQLLLQGSPQYFQTLQQEAATALEKPYIDFKSVLQGYK